MNRKRFRAFLNQKLAYLRRAARAFITPHTGLQPSINLVKFKTRVRKATKKASFVWRKKANFVTPHTGLQPLFVGQFRTRARKVRKQASFVLRKLVKFDQWHTGLTSAIPNPISVIQFKNHKKYKLKQRKAKFKLVSPIHSGLQQSTFLVLMKTRKRKIRKYKKYKGFRLTGIRFTGATPPSSAKRNWLPVSLAAATRRGGD